MTVLEILQQAKQGTKVVPLSVSTKTDEKDSDGKAVKVGKEFEAPLPTSLNAAVEILGEKAVHRYFINALVVDLQASERAKLAPASKGEGRKKAKYLEVLGL